MDILSPSIETYIERHSDKEPELLRQLTRETHSKVLQSRMLSGHYQGRLLSLISQLVGPKNILEIGTYTGYSALCLAEGLQQDGALHTIDINEELYDFQRLYFDRSGMGEKIHQHLGDAREIIPEIDLEFDLVFIDADKPNYPVYLDLIFEKLRPGGVLLSDNVLWSGKVIQELQEGDDSTEALMEYNRKLAEDPRFHTVMLPVRDGLTISRKK